MKDSTLSIFEIFPDNIKDVKEVLNKIIKEQVRKMILEQNMRPDDEIK